MNASDIAHQAVADNMSGKAVSPATIKADLIARGMSAAQATTLTKMSTALIPTVTAASMKAWRRAAA